jgi:outer membrane receptor protein involved in Fe transport
MNLKHSRAPISVGAAVRRSLLSVSLLASIAGPAFAQSEETSLDEVIVTGSRIASPNATSSSPILAVTAESLRQSGINDTGDLVDFLPQVISVAGVDLSNTSNPLSGPGGVTTVNLRGLGPQRTLVLVDGRRLGVGDPDTGNPNSAPDINQIPASLIERIDVVTGGASAAYGSDAIAGVVNFVLKRDFEGVQIDAQYGFLQHNQQSDFMQDLLTAANLPQPSSNVTDGENYSVSVLVGGNFADGRGNATAYLSFFSSEPVTLAERDFSACQLSGNGTACGGSSSSNLFRRTGTNQSYSVQGTNLIPRVATQNTTPPFVFNSNPYMNLFQGTDRYQAGVLSRFEFNEHAEVYGDFMFMNNRHETAVAPSGLFQQTFQVNCNNPLLSAQQQTTLGCTAAQIANGDQIGMVIGRRNIEGGPREFGYEHTNYRGVLGVKGDINDAWSYDTYGSYYYTTLYNTNKNYVSLARGSLALNGCLTGPGQVSAVLDTSCVPWNIWRDGGVTQEASDYIATYGVSNGSTSQTIFSASTTGDLGAYGIQLPTAREGVAVAVGVEWRDDTFKYLPDLNLGSGDLSGGSGASPTIDESASVTELFFEGRIPLVQDMTAAQLLELEVGYRYSDYELSGGVDTYKAGLQWQPIDDLRFRASYNHAIRAPSLIELFVPQTVTQTSDISVDPCAPLNGVAATATLAECQRTGVTAAQYGNGLSTNLIPQCVSSQCSTLTGGNPDLEPEEADTISVGVTFTPGFLPGFSMSLDWYRIETEGLVGIVPLSVSMQGCLNGSQPLYCQNIVRDAEGSITGDFVSTGGYVAGTNFNVAEGTFTGIDIQGTYDISLGGLGSLQAALNGVYLDETSTVPLAGELRYDCAGLYGNTCGSALPDWRHTLRLTWSFPVPVQASLQWRYVSSVTHEQNTDDPTLTGTPVTFGGTLGSRSYLDLSGAWDINETFTVRAGINNILDKDPPLVDTGWSGPGTPNTWGPYDTLGRQIFVSGTARF